MFAWWWQLISYLRVLQAISLEYHLVDIPKEETLQRTMEDCHVSILHKAEWIQDLEILALETLLGCNIAKAQQMQIQDHDMPNLDRLEQQSQPQAESNDNVSPLPMHV